MQKALPGRFYRDVRAEPLGDGFALALDGRIAKTPAKHDLVVPTRALAEAVAGEWQAQGEKIDFAAMPLTRLAFTAIDGIAGKVQAVIDDIVKYSETDLVCYRAAEPASLVAAQAAAWEPVLDFAATQLGARFLCAASVIFISQPEAARAAIAARVAEIGGGMNAPFALASLSTMDGSDRLDPHCAGTHRRRPEPSIPLGPPRMSMKTFRPANGGRIARRRPGATYALPTWPPRKNSGCSSMGRKNAWKSSTILEFLEPGA
ncbi:MAG: ATP12 family chaperone protein [Methylovirgula sp.]